MRSRAGQRQDDINIDSVVARCDNLRHGYMARARVHARVRHEIHARCVSACPQLGNVPVGDVTRSAVARNAFE